MQGDKNFISCPSCRKPTQLPNIEATDLPAAFLINNLLQLQDKLKKISCEEVNMECEIHRDPLKVYCDTCKGLICRDCTISQYHKNHKYKLVAECYPDHHQEIEAHLTKVKRKVADIDVAVTTLINREREITKQGDEVKKEIHTQAQLIINLVQQSERQLVQQVDTVVQLKIQLLTKQIEVTEAILKQLKGCEEFVEQSLKLGSQQQVLREKQSIIQVMATVNQDVNTVVFQPIEEANITFTGNQALKDIGKLKHKTFDKAVLHKSACYHDKKSTITLNLHTNDGSLFSVPPSLISCELSSAGDNQTISNINENKLGGYNISFIPRNCGKYWLKVKLGGVDVPGSPFNLFVEKIGKPKNIISGLDRPFGIVITKNEEIVVAESSAHCITILNKEGEKVRSFGRKGKKAGQFTSPTGVAISDDGYILVTDEHRLQKLTFEGNFVQSVGSSEIGIGCLQFNAPTGITVHPNTGQIFIADTGNNRIQILDSDLSYFDSFICMVTMVQYESK